MAQDPWAVFRPQNQAPQQPQVEPQPFPGAQPITVQRNPSKVTADQQAATRTEIDVHGDRRADTALGMEAERLRIAREKAEADAKARAANGGVETTASQDMASGHAIMLGTNLAVLQGLSRKNPRALVPTWTEKFATGLSGDDPDVKAWSQSPDRQVADNAYRNILESAIYLSTGAAAPPDQVKRIAGTLMPSMFDKPETMAYKRRLLEAYIAQARERAGPADVKAQEALSGLTDNLGAMYGIGSGSVWEQESPPRGELSTTRKSVPIPPEMQAEYQSWMNQHPPGTLELGQYLDFYQGLTKKYGFDLPVSSIVSAKDYVANYNKGYAGLTIPRPDRELTPAEKLLATAADSDVGTFVRHGANALTFGVPEMLAGREARYAGELADEKHPKSAIAGEIAGSLAPVAGLESLAARGAGKLIEGKVARKVASEVAGNAAYGGIRGYTGVEPENRGEAALLGALVGGVAPLATRGVVKGARGFMGDTTREAVDDLAERSFEMPGDKTGTIPAVDLTTAQRAGLGAQEEALQGVPFVRGAREKAVESWNKQNSARVLAKIGEELPADVRPGQDMNAYVNRQLNQAYNRIRPAINGRVDGPFNNAVAALRKKSVGTSPERQELWDQIEEALQKFRKPDGTFDGNGYRELSTQLRRLSDVWTSNNQAAMSTAAQDMARTAEQVRKQAQALVGRANPAAGRRLKQLESAWAHQVRIEAASRGAAKATRGVYAPDEYLGAIERLDTSRNKAAVARGKGLDQPYAQNARDVLGGKPAKKASIKETAVGAASLHFGGVPAAAIISTLGLGYVPGVKRLVQAIVEGKLGATPEAVTKALQGSKIGDTFLKGISADARQKLLEQLIQAEARKSATQ